jgi:hypothetical protein
MMVGWCLNLLLRAPEAYPMTARRTGPVVLAGLDGDGVEIRTADGTVVHSIVVDRATGRLLGALSRHRASDGAGYTLVERFERHRSIAGLNVPMAIHQTRVPDDRAVSVPAISGVMQIGSLEFSPPPAAGLFTRPAKR